MKICAIVLTHNEEIHLDRCLSSLHKAVDHILVVDCFSNDSTVDIARAHHAEVLTRPWTNHADQFNWALTQTPLDTDWVLRIDADEYLTEDLADEISRKLNQIPDHIAGIILPRHMFFQGEMIRYGGVFPVHIIRLFRKGKGRCEARWMDEHIEVDGPCTHFSGRLIDDNRKSLTWWTEKHNKYASREVVDILNQEYDFMARSSVSRLLGGGQAGSKRWIKENIYARLPSGLRALLYFLYRYVIRFGFLDGPAGRRFHVLQAFWYRYLVDAKLQEVRAFMKAHEASAEDAIRAVLGVDVSAYRVD